MTALSKLRNIGTVSAGWLESVGIQSRDDLEAIGAVEAYRRVKLAFPDRVSLNMLYALQGALLDIPWDLLPDDMKAELKARLDK